MILTNLFQYQRNKLLRINSTLKIEDLMKRFLLTPIFKTFKRRTFFSSLEQNNCPVYDAEEIKKQEQKEAIKKLYP
mgnify:FL=1